MHTHERERSNVRVRREKEKRHLQVQENSWNSSAREWDALNAHVLSVFFDKIDEQDHAEHGFC